MIGVVIHHVDLPHTQCAITIFKNTFGETKDLPWNLLHNLGYCSQLQGKYVEADAMYRQALHLHETVLGKDHPSTLGSMMGLAASLGQQGKYAEAEVMK